MEISKQKQIAKKRIDRERNIGGKSKRFWEKKIESRDELQA